MSQVTSRRLLAVVALLAAMAALLAACSGGPATLPASQSRAVPVATHPLEVTAAPSATPTPQIATSAPSPSPTWPLAGCPHVPLGGFGDVWRNDQVWPRLGCAIAPAESVSGTEAYLCCGHSIWLSERHLFVVVDDILWQFIADKSGLPEDAPLMVELAPRPEPCFPATGRHRWLAQSPLLVETCKGLSESAETPFTGAMQQFQNGWLLWNGDVCFVLFSDGSMTMF